jgi:uncharacterized membrane protein
MNLAPLIEAPMQIQVHVAAVAVAMALGPVQLLLPKGTRGHVFSGRVWVGAMVVTCLSAMLILDRPFSPSIGPFSWLHGLALFTLAMLYRAVRLARAGDIWQHRITMTCLILFALGIPAIFAVAVPGRILNKAFFGPALEARASP